MKRDITFDEMFDVIEARLKVMELRLTLWSWRVQNAQPHHLRAVEASYGKALDHLWKAQERAA